MTPRACVIGWPVAHSRSPLIHGHWLRHYGLSGCYDKAPVEPPALAGFLAAMPAAGLVGGNVTIPHKEAAARLCVGTTERAKRLGGVNTLWFDDGQLHGDSTDGEGFCAALDAEAPGWDVRRQQALVLGAGGAARAIVDVLLRRGFARVVVANRTIERAATLCADLGGEPAGLDAVSRLLGGTDLLVNTTAVGMSGVAAADALPLDLALLPRHAVVDDIVYVPLETDLLARARAVGLRTVGGLGMLLHQAVPGFEKWFGIRPEVTPALRAIVEADVRAGSLDGAKAR